MRTLLLALASLSLLAQPTPQAVGKAPNSTSFNQSIFFAGQPSVADLAEYKKLGVTTVVNLRTPDEMKMAGIDEVAATKAAGLKYVNVPIGATPPTDSDLERIYAELLKAPKEKVLLHCASSNRVGMVWAIFRGTQQKVAPEEALAEGKAAGLKAPALEKFAREKLRLK